MLAEGLQVSVGGIASSEVPPIFPDAVKVKEEPKEEPYVAEDEMPWVVEILMKANLHTVSKKVASANQWVMTFCAEEEDLLDSNNLFALEEFPWPLS
ncbi:hypothetical protein N9L68_07095 [bacterium]|nr:hypothetical protein [bacterium]